MCNIQFLDQPGTNPFKEGTTMTQKQQQDGAGSTKNLEKNGMSRDEAIIAARRAKQRKGHNGPRREQHTGFFAGLQQDRQDARRHAFIEALDNTVKNARDIADDLFPESSQSRIREIIEMVITKHYELSIASRDNRSARFEDSQEAVLKELQALARTTGSKESDGFLKYATFRGLDALKGAHTMVAYERSLEDAVAIIEGRNEARRSNRQSAPKRELAAV